MISEIIFKAYDIRGIYPDEINEVTAKKIGKAFAKFANLKRMIIGRDMRVSSPSVAEAVIDGILSQGVDMVDIGMVSTPVFYHAVGADESIDGGLIVTASHNPGQYSGMKMVLGNLLPVGQGSGMEEIKKLVLEDSFTDSEVRGTIEYRDVMQDYLDKIFSLVDINKIKPLKIVVDTGNGINGPITQEVAGRLPQIDMLPLFFRPDGTFPNHEANPLHYETLKELQNRVIMQNAHIGFAFDGDGDRIGVVDEGGRIVPGDFLTAIIAQELLKRDEFQNKTMLADLRSSWAVKEAIEQNGGKHQECRVGHAFIKKQMRELDAVFAGELSCHFYYKNFYYVESGDLSMLLLLQALSESKKPFSEMVDPLKKYFQSGEINSEVEDKEGVMKKLEEKYREGAKNVSHMDGIKIEHEEYWFNVRPSNTEPVLRLNLEARTEEKMQEMKEELLAVIRNA